MAMALSIAATPRIWYVPELLDNIESLRFIGLFFFSTKLCCKEAKTHPAQTYRNTITRKLCSLQSVFKYQKVNNYEAIFEGTNCGHRRWKRVLQEPGIALVVSHLQMCIYNCLYTVVCTIYPILSYPFLSYPMLSNPILSYLYICEVLQTPSKNNTTQCWVGYDTTYRSSFMDKKQIQKKTPLDHSRPFSSPYPHLQRKPPSLRSFFLAWAKCGPQVATEIVHFGVYNSNFTMVHDISNLMTMVSCTTVDYSIHAMWGPFKIANLV